MLCVGWLIIRFFHKKGLDSRGLYFVDAKICMLVNQAWCDTGGFLLSKQIGSYVQEFLSP